MSYFEIYDEKTGLLKLSPEFKLPQMNTDVGPMNIPVYGSNEAYHIVSSAFDPRATTVYQMRAYDFWFSNTSLDPLFKNKKYTNVWINFQRDEIFAPLFITYNPSTPSFSSYFDLFHGGTATKSMKLVATSMDDYGSYSDKYLSVYNAKGELTWSIDRILKSPKVIGSLTVPAASNNNVNVTGFMPLPAGIDLSRVYILPNLCFSYYDFSDQAASYYLSAVSYCITAQGVYGRMFSKLNRQNFKRQDLHILVAYI